MMNTFSTTVASADRSWEYRSVTVETPSGTMPTVTARTGNPRSYRVPPSA